MSWFLIGIVILIIVIFVLFYVLKNTNIIEVILNMKFPKFWKT